jgi:hypothetical protein
MPPGSPTMTLAELQSLGFADDHELVDRFAEVFGMRLDVVDDTVRRQAFDAVMKKLYAED